MGVIEIQRPRPGTSPASAAVSLLLFSGRRTSGVRESLRYLTNVSDSPHDALPPQTTPLSTLETTTASFLDTQLRTPEAPLPLSARSDLSADLLCWAEPPTGCWGASSPAPGPHLVLADTRSLLMQRSRRPSAHTRQGPSRLGHPGTGHQAGLLWLLLPELLLPRHLRGPLVLPASAQLSGREPSLEHVF